jgi:hypothetical protein
VHGQEYLAGTQTGIDRHARDQAAVTAIDPRKIAFGQTQSRGVGRVQLQQRFRNVSGQAR